MDNYDSVRANYSIFLPTTFRLQLRKRDYHGTNEAGKIAGMQGLILVGNNQAKRMIVDINFVQPGGTRVFNVTCEIVDVKEFERSSLDHDFNLPQ